MLGNTKVEITIKKVEGGFVVDWEHQKPKRVKHSFASRDRDEDDDLWDPRGTEIVVKEADLMKRVKELLSKA